MSQCVTCTRALEATCLPSTSFQDREQVKESEVASSLGIPLFLFGSSQEHVGTSFLSSLQHDTMLLFLSATANSITLSLFLPSSLLQNDKETGPNKQLGQGVATTCQICPPYILRFPLSIFNFPFFTSCAGTWYEAVAVVVKPGFTCLL